MPPRNGRDAGAAAGPPTCCARRRRRAAAPTWPGCCGPGAGVARRRSLIFVISDFISEPGWERARRQLTERHEVVAIRLVDPHELELPDAGVIVVEDVETGELLLRRHERSRVPPPVPRHRHGAGGRAAGRRRSKPASRCTTCPPKTTWCARSCASSRAGGGRGADVVPLARHARPPAGRPAGGRRATWRSCAGGPPGRRSWPPWASCRTPRPGGCVGCATSRPCCSSSRSWCWSWPSLARGERRPAPSRGHRHPGLRRLEQHAGQGPRSRPGWTRPSRRPKQFVDKQPSSIKIGVVAFNNGGAHHAAADDRQGRRAGRDRAPRADRARRRSVRGSSRR